MHKSLNAPVLGALRCFESAARHLSFTRAGEELHLTTGAISQQIRQLEERLGCLLFNRLGRGLTLTPEGRALKAAVGTAFGVLTEAITGLGKAMGPLVLSCSPSFAMLWLMPRLPAFRSKYPDIQIKVVAEFQSVDRHSLAVGNIDAAIRYDPIDYQGIGEAHLMNEYLLPVATPTYLKQESATLRKAGFDGLTLLHDAAPWDGAPQQIEWQSWLQATKTQLGSSITSQEFNLFMLALSAARNSNGICMGRAALILPELQDGTLVEFTGRIIPSSGNYKLISARTQEPRIRLLTEWLQEECKITETLRDQYLGISEA